MTHHPSSPALDDCFLTEEQMTHWTTEEGNQATPPPKARKEPVFCAAVPLADLHEVRRLDGAGGGTVMLFLALHHQSKITRSPIVAVAGKVADYFCLSRTSISRSMKILEAAGFVKVVSRAPGSSLHVSLRWISKF